MIPDLDPAARSSPAALRNRDAIADVLRDILPMRGTTLEIASGSGEHAIHFARLFPHLAWQPSDPDPEARASIAAYRAEAQLPNLLAPLALDAASETWPIAGAEAVLAINMIHISPWRSTLGLIAGAARVLAGAVRCCPAGGLLMLYGPFIEPDRPLASSNAAFDADLRRRDPAWGLRRLDEVASVATRHGFALEARYKMPANNLALVFRTSSGAGTPSGEPG